MTSFSIAFLACETTLPDSQIRRVDAFEFDRQFGQLEHALKAHGAKLAVYDWKDKVEKLTRHDAVIVGTTWTYQDETDAFLAKLEAIEGHGTPLFNPSALIRWNIDKTYLKEIAKKGAKTVPTLWVDTPLASHIETVFETYACEGVVIKRQVGAGAEGQRLFKRGETVPDGPLLDRPAMIQPFMPAIKTEGEYSFIFIDGQFSHALLKMAKSGDYRIQSSYGGYEKAITPNQTDIDAARRNLDFIPFDMPLYARIDLVRGADDQLKLMEAEMIEPYLYPVEGPDMGHMYAKALLDRLR